MGKFKWPKCCKCGNCLGLKQSQEYVLQPLPKPKEASEETDGLPWIDSKEDADVLIIRKINPCISINGHSHHTSKYELMNRAIEPQLVVRRGQSFQLELTLSRPYNEEKDAISFIFTVDGIEKPNYGNGTLIAIPLLKKPERSYSWNVVYDRAYENILIVQIQPSPDTVVAKWQLEIDTKIIDDGAYCYCWEARIYILFNPWCKSDQVYMKSTEWRDETVLNDAGIMWRGTANRMRPVIWKYDQFEKDVLECALYVLQEIGKVKIGNCNDPVQITRALAASVNSVDDDGVVMGDWSEDHSDGTPPTKWLGSKDILQKYYKKKKPVKYGQCWVFSGVLTTICRALGIPSRPVTNYSSAHDTQTSLTVDYFMDQDGKILEELNSDSIWNFHVWNEVWMERPDLGREYGGWQAIDATPQELSDGIYRVGPASVIAVKHGEVLRPYDAAFVFAEVNADKVFWKYSGKTQPLKLLRKDIYGIGKQISTKTPGRFEREDITSSYKFPEKTTEERATMLRALRQSENLFARYYLNEDFNDIYFNFELRDDIKIGQPFDVALVMKNRSKTKDYRVAVILRVEVATYTGKIGDSVKKEDYNVEVKANSILEIKMNVTYNEYAKHLIDQCSFNIACLANVADTRFEYYAQDDFRVRKPDIKIMLQNKPIQNKEIVADIAVENSLPVPYKKGEFTIDIPGYDKPVKIKIKDAVPPGGKAQGQFKFVVKDIGTYTIAAKFVAKEIDDVDGYVNIVVEENREENGNRPF